MKRSQKLIMIYMTVKRKETRPYLKLETFSMKAVSSVMMRYAIMSSIVSYVVMFNYTFAFESVYVCSYGMFKYGTVTVSNSKYLLGNCSINFNPILHYLYKIWYLPITFRQWNLYYLNYYENLTVTIKNNKVIVHNQEV